MLTFLYKPVTSLICYNLSFCSPELSLSLPKQDSSLYYVQNDLIHLKTLD